MSGNFCTFASKRKKIMRKILLVLLSVIVLLTSCSDSSKVYKIGVAQCSKGPWREKVNKEMLAAMTDKQREVFLLYYKEGYTQQQIADMLGCVVSMVNKHLKASLKRIKKFF